MKYDDMPTGFCMVLAQNTEAVNKFAALDDDKKQEIINATKNIRSKDEMRRLVSSILSEY